MLKKNVAILLGILIILCAGIRVWFAVNTSYTADDAYITFRYAENLAAGKGFVYNPGDKILGTTSPSYTFLLSLFKRAGMNVRFSSLIINIVTDCANVLFIFLIGMRLLDLRLGFLIALVLVFFTSSIKWSISGMEVSFYVTLLLATFYFHLNQKYALSGWSSGLAFLTRIEGVLLIIAVVADFVLRHRRIPWLTVISFLAVVCPWLTFSFFYFGSIIPHSAIAKKIFYSTGFFSCSPWSVFQLFLWYSYEKIAFLVFLLPGGVGLFLKSKASRVILLWLLFYLLFFAFSHTHIFGWYLLPFYILYFLPVGAGMLFLIDFLNKEFLRKACYAFLVILIILSASVRLPALATQLLEEQDLLNHVHKQVGLWLSQNSKPDDRIYLTDMGYMGYYSGRRIVDQVGLVSKEIVEFNKDRDWIGGIKHSNPAFCVLGLYGPINLSLVADPWFGSSYRQVKRIFHYKGNPASLSLNSAQRVGSYVPDYVIFEKVRDD